MFDDIFSTLGSYIMRDAAADAKTRKEEATKQLVDIKDSQGINVDKNTDGTLATTWVDKLNSLLTGVGQEGTNVSDIQSGYNTKQVERKSSELIDKNPTIDYTGIDRTDYDAVQAHTDFQTQLKLKQSQGYDTTGVTDRAGLKATVAEQDLQASNKKTKGSITYQDSRSDRAEDIARETAISDRNFGLQLQTLTSQNEQALATLQASIEQAKMQNEQATLDREYLDRRDLRDYNYQIKKDDQEQMDKIFALLIGGVDKIFG